MAFRDSWHRALVYFGLAEDRMEHYETAEHAVEPEAEIEERYRDRPNVRRLSSRRRRDDFDDIFADDEPAGPQDRRASSRSAAARNGGGDVRVHLVIPKSFNDAQQVADKFKDSIPVVLNLQGDRHRPLEAPDRLRQRAHLRARRRHAADRRQGLHAHAAQRRDLGRRARAADREGLLQPVVRSGSCRLRSRLGRWHGRRSPPAVSCGRSPMPRCRPTPSSGSARWPAPAPACSARSSSSASPTRSGRARPPPRRSPSGCRWTPTPCTACSARWSATAGCDWTATGASGSHATARCCARTTRARGGPGSATSTSAPPAAPTTRWRTRCAAASHRSRSPTASPSGRTSPSTRMRRRCSPRPCGGARARSCRCWSSTRGLKTAWCATSPAGRGP